MDARSGRRRLAPARLLTPDRVAFAAVGLGGLALGTASLFIMGAVDRVVPLLVGACTALLSLPVARRVLRNAARPQDLTAPVLAWCVAAGILNTPTSLLAVSLLVADSPVSGPEAPAMLFVATLFGAIIAGPLGFLFGALYLVPLRRAVAERAARSLDGGDRALAASGSWLGAVALASLSIAVLWSTVGEVAEGLVAPVAASLLGLALVGFAAAGVAEARRRRRLALLDGVRAGEVEGLEVLRRADLCAEAQTLPTLGAETAEEAEALDGVLVERRAGPDRGAYRSPDEVAPVALVRLDPLDPPARPGAAFRRVRGIGPSLPS